MDYGVLCIIPPLVVVVLAIVSRTSFEPLLIGCLVGFVIIGHYEHSNVFSDFIASLYKIMEDESSVWVILVCGLYGSLIGLMVRSGGTMKFGEWALQRLKSKSSALMGTWLLGLAIFLDDYLSALTVGLSMRKITDAYKVPRSMLAYIVNTTAAPWCVIVPISTWTIFVGKVLETSHVAPKGAGLSTYWKMIPFVSYGYISVLIIPLFIYGIVPWFGRMRKYAAVAETTGQLTQTAFSMTSALDISPFAKTGDGGRRSGQGAPKVIYFLLPVIVLMAATVYFDIDALKGVMIAVSFTFLYYWAIRLGNFRQLSETIFSGFNSMVYALAILMMSYVLKDVNDKMGLTQYVLHGVSPYVNRQLLPVLVFGSLSVIAVTTGSSWGLYAVSIPLVVPLAQHLGSNVLLNCGAVVSAGVFGSNACLYSDATILTAQSTECNNLENGLTQMPYALIAFALSCVAYIIFGYTIS
jgi:Na+/H+ antiporter NhaC